MGVVRYDMVVVSSDPVDDESTATAGLLIGKIRARVFRFCLEGICMLADMPPLDEEKYASTVIKGARAMIIVLSRGSLECVSQLQAIVTTPANVDTIPVFTPGFNTPSTSYFDEVLPKIWPGEEALANVRRLFQLSSVIVTADAMDDALEAHASLVLDRIPR